jgi:hypothetical protein
MLFRLLVAVALLFAGVPAADGVVATSQPARVPAAPAASQVAVDTPAVQATVTEHDVVVPAVKPAVGIVTSPDVLTAQETAGAIVTDNIVAANRVESPVIETGAFQTLGLTWPRDVAVGSLGGQVRTRTAGTWSTWVPLLLGDSPDAGSADGTRAARGGTDPMWVGDADAVQLSFSATAGGGPRGLSLALVGSPQVAPQATAPVAATAASATGTPSIVNAAFVTSRSTASVVSASVAAPHVITRAEWGARAPACTPDVASGLVGAVLHHTADPNTYSTVAQAMQQIRNDQAYHIDGRGWCDIGYNFLVDKWGNIYEGRIGSMTAPVVGAHAGGYNTGTVGISMLGTYSTVVPSAATQEAVAQVVAWRLSGYFRNPAGQMVYTTGGGSDKYAAGTTLTLPVVLGHRDVSFTACPGEAGYATLGWLRARAKQIIGASLVNPALSTTSVAMGGSVNVLAQTISNLNWTLTVTDARTGVVVSASIGYAQEAFGGVVATWDGRNLKGQPVGPGPYRLSLTAVSAATGAAVLPWSGVAQVSGSQNPPVVSPVPLVGDLTFVPITPTRVADTRPDAQSLGPVSRMDVVVAGVAGVPAGAKAVALNITAVHASAMTYLRAWPAGASMPASSVLNTDPARTVATSVVLGVGGEGKVSLYNNSGSVHLAVDVSGYYVSTGGDRYEPLASPARLLDTRTSGGRMSTGSSRTVQVGGVAGVPIGATAAVVNVTSVGASAAGYVVAVPFGSGSSTSSTVNNRPLGDATNRATVALTDGKLDVRLVGGDADVVVDVVGWYGTGATTRLTPIAPVRALDTRTSSSPMRAGESREVPIRDLVGAPADTGAVVAVVTATQQTAWATFLTVWDGVAARPATSDLNTGARGDESNLVVARLAPSGGAEIYNNLGTTHLVIDAYGYFR